MAEIRAERIWGLTTGPEGKGLTAAFAESDTDPIAVYGPTDLVCDATVLGVPADSVEFRLDVAFDGGDFAPLPSLLDQVDTATFGDREYEMPGALGTERIVFSIPWACTVQLMAKRTGGGAGTLLNVYAWGRKLGAGGSGGGGALATMGAGGIPVDPAYDPVINAYRSAEQAGPETVLTGETLFEETPGVDGTYNYYVEHDGRRTFALDLIIVPGTAPGVAVTLEASWQDDGTAIAARVYHDVTFDLFAVATFTASAQLIDNIGRLKDAKSLKFKVVANTGGANDGGWTGYYKSSY